MLKNLTHFIQLRSLRYYVTKPVIKTRNRSAPDDLPLISCKRHEFNLTETESGHVKFGSIPLASNGWLHRKSKGDWFHINPTINEEDMFDEMKNISSFLTDANLSVDNILIENLRNELNIEKLTQIQCLSWPKISENNHTLIAAETGCGKTLAYLVPIIQNILERKRRCEKIKNRKFNSPLSIILTPGRELSEQINHVAEQLCQNTDITVKVILGGNTKRKILNPDFSDVDILVASFGALSKLVTTGIYRVDHVRHVVLDEADSLLDDSFIEKLVHLLKRFPFFRNHYQTDLIVGTQLILASATMPTNIQESLEKIINVETLEEVVSDNLHRLMPHVKQRFMRVNKSDRPAHMLTIVKKELKSHKSLIIFSNKTPTCDYVDIFLNNSGINCLNLNGDMPMKIRTGRFEKFQNGECDVLSTTDVGSRGLDTTRAQHVINYDFPLHISDYIHRCGRIGRVGSMSKCLVTNLISSRREIDIVQKIEHAARIGGFLPDVNANIKSIINRKILQEMNEADSLVEDSEQEPF